ncbi:hypothetical protein FRC17_005068, partial [Serendipita sp. 399]
CGQNVIDISQLPSVLEEDSIRVDGIGGTVIITGVVYQPPNLNEARKKHDEAVKELKKEKSRVKKEISIHKRQEYVLEKYSGTLGGMNIDTAKLADFLKVYAQQQTEIDENLEVLYDKLDDIDKKIEEEGQAQSVDSEGRKRGTRITVHAITEHEVEVDLYLTYMVPNALWQPLYDIRATIDAEGTFITLQYRAKVVQSTGEDWNEVELTLSSASPQHGSAIPSLEPLSLDIIEHARRYQPESQRRTIYARPAFKKGAGAGHGPRKAVGTGITVGEVDQGAGHGLRKAVGTGITVGEVDQGAGHGLRKGLGSVIMVGEVDQEGYSTIPSDTDATSQAHKVSIAVADLSADLQWITTPKEIPSVFLQAQVKNTSAYVFLPGKASIFLDNSFVAKSQLDQVSPNETFQISFGVDSQLKVTYHPRTKKTRVDGGLLTTRTHVTSYFQKITVKNARNALIPKLLIRDQIPVASDQRIKVALLEPASLEFGGRTGTGPLTTVPKAVQISKGLIVRWKPDNDDSKEGTVTTAATNGSGAAGLDGARRGMIEWVCAVGSGQRVDVSLSWEVTTPMGLEWGPQ